MTKPMLCKTYDPEKPYQPAFLQPKLDGIRCIAHLKLHHTGPYISLESRNEKPLNLLHLTKPLLAMFARLGNTKFFDGELYLHGKSFQDLASMIKREDHPQQDQIEYHIYDRQLLHPWEDQKFDTRFYGMDWPKAQNIVKVPTFYSPTRQDADKYHAKFVASGYEGSILRVGACKYEEDKRSKQLLKRKDWQEEEFTVINVKEGKGKNKGTAIFVCTTQDYRDVNANQEWDASKTFDVTAPGTYKQKAIALKRADEFLGESISVKYQNLTDGGIPRFPIAIGFKDDR